MRVNRKVIFDAAKRRGAVFKRIADVQDFDAAIDAALASYSEKPLEPPKPAITARRVNKRGIDLIHSFEQCKLEAYPDPGSHDGKPITIGWGSTSNMDGSPIRLGDRWNKEQCDARFEKDLARFSEGVERLLAGAPTTDNQFAALVSFTYNLGVAALGGSTLLRMHKAGDYHGAARQFLRWNKNGKPLRVMRGLTRRRLAESDLYDDPA